MGLFDGKKFDLQSTVGKIQGKLADFSQTTGTPVAQESSMQQVMPTFCTNCGTRLNTDAKFCHGCGAAVGAILHKETQVAQEVSSVTQTPPIPHPPVQPTNYERQQEYVGKIFKCPNCGSQITETTAVCPNCGAHITGKDAVSSVSEFNAQLMQLESHRKKSLAGMFGIYGTADPVDKQKLTLIRNYPIPNSIDDCFEFMILAISNVDVKLSKNSWANSGGSGEVMAIDMPKAISNAWVSKMEQVYLKARMAFPNDPAFEGIKEMYYDKMKELKIKVKA